MDIQKEFQHHSRIQIRFNDIDMLGHVNNAVYQHYFDLARMNYFAKVIGEDLDWNDFGLVMANISIDFFKPVKLKERVLVRSGIELIGEKSLTMVQEIYNEETGEIKCQNRCVMVGYSSKKNQTSIIPSNWSKKIFEFESKVEFKYPA
jgi:acyl-CoA thioester hydrolase